MDFLPTVVLTLLLGVGCGYFQYWMDTRLVKKRWLLWLQPALLAGVTACFTAWILSIGRLKGTSARWAGLPFAMLLVCTLIGWAVGRWRRKRG